MFSQRSSGTRVAKCSGCSTKIWFESDCKACKRMRMALHSNHEPSRNRFTVNLFIPHTGMCAIYCHPKVDGSVLKTINIVDWLGLRLWPIPMKKNLYTVSFISINRYAHLFILFICTYMSFVGRCCRKRLHILGWIVWSWAVFVVSSFVTEVAKTKPGAREDSFGGMDHETCSFYSSYTSHICMQQTFNFNHISIHTII